jgi:hypothetical protein
MARLLFEASQIYTFILEIRIFHLSSRSSKLKKSNDGPGRAGPAGGRAGALDSFSVADVVIPPENCDAFAVRDTMVHLIF